MTPIQAIVCAVLLFAALSSAQTSIPLCFEQIDNTTETNAYYSDRFGFPIYQNYSTAQREVLDNSSQWILTLLSLFTSSGAPGLIKQGSMYAFLNSTTNGESYILSADSAADFKIRVTPDYGWLTIQDLSFPGYVSNNTHYVIPQNVSFNVSVPYAEFRTFKPPDSLHFSTYTTREKGTNCTIMGQTTEGANTIPQFKPLTLELKFYDGRHLWFNFPVSLKYSAFFSRAAGAQFFVNCPACASVYSTSTK